MGLGDERGECFGAFSFFLFKVCCGFADRGYYLVSSPI